MRLWYGRASALRVSVLLGMSRILNKKRATTFEKIACASLTTSIAPAAAQLVTVAESLLTEDSFHSRARIYLLDNNLKAKWRILATSDNFIFASIQYLVIL